MSIEHMIPKKVIPPSVKIFSATVNFVFKFMSDFFSILISCFSSVSQQFCIKMCQVLRRKICKLRAFIRTRLRFIRAGISIPKLQITEINNELKLSHDT